MVKRKIIKIDDTLCDGCGICAIACAEGAIEIADGKARVISDSFCDGLGACIGECPKGALCIEEREALEFDEAAALAAVIGRPGSAEPAAACASSDQLPARHEFKVEMIEEGDDICSMQSASSPESRLLGLQGRHADTRRPGCSAAFRWMRRESPGGAFQGRVSSSESAEVERPGLSSWPIQMRLAHPDAPYFREASLLIAADCTGFASLGIHEKIQGRPVLIGCPKLDEAGLFVEKLADILRMNKVVDLTVLHMEVPCCANLERLVKKAVAVSKTTVTVKSITLGIGGDILD